MANCREAEPVNTAQILDEIRRHFEETGAAPGLSTFLRAHPDVPPTAFRGLYWAKWSDALAEAGVTAREFTAATDEELLFRPLAELTRSLGRYPSQAELRLQRRRDPSFPVESTLRSRFGTTPRQVMSLREWCTTRPDFDDVVQICSVDGSVTADAIPEPDDLSDIKAGFVYLMRSTTRGHKIGMTSSMSRRWAQIEGADPGEVELVHHFKTIDMAGIEAYWLHRFDAQRKRNDREWFSL